MAVHPNPAEPEPRRDRYHKRAVQCLEGLSELLITTWPVMTETCHLLLHRLGGEAQIAFMRSYASEAFEVFDIDNESKYRNRVLELMIQYADLPMDFADATLVQAAKRHGIDQIFTLDRRDFAVYRLRRGKAFTIIPDAI